MSDASGRQGIPGWVWGMLVGLAIFGAGFFLGNLGDRETIDASAPASSQQLTTAPTTLAPADTTTSLLVLEDPTTAPPQTSPQFSNLPPVLVTELPLEAWDTLDLIASGGPYPFDRDGLTFENREGLLPDYPRGHYQEFTVITPGESTRGARRIVAGASGELYYTADHYSSFREIRYED